MDNTVNNTNNQINTPMAPSGNIPGQKPMNLFQKYKFLFIPIGLVLILGFILLLIQKTSEYPQKNINRNATEAQGPTPTGGNGRALKNLSKLGDSEYTIDPENLQGITSQEKLQDGTIKYTLKSNNVTRQDVLIAKGSSFIFRRAVFTPDYQQRLDQFVNLYGDPDRVVQGSKVYGSGTAKYIYASLGFTLFVDTKTKLVTEQHIYPPMTVDEYLAKFGDEQQ